MNLVPPILKFTGSLSLPSVHPVKLVPDSPYRMKIAGLSGIDFDFLPNIADMHHNGVPVVHRRLSPDPGVNLLDVEHLSRMASQQLDYRELAGG
ncbi:hypothetical protein D3C73_1331190 [compost metagenome]